MPYKDDKPKDAEIPPFKAGSDYSLLVNYYYTIKNKVKKEFFYLVTQS